MQPGGRITTTQLAKICNVSQGTVDRALNNRPGISVATKQKVLEAAKKYGYAPNIHARYLAGGKSMLVGILVFDLYNDFFSNMVMELESICREKDYSTVVMFSDKKKGNELECIQRLVHMGVDGIILCPVSEGEQYADYLKSFHIPVVTLMNQVEGIPCVGIDDFGTMKAVTEYVISRGYSEIIYYSPPLSYAGEQNIYAQQQRFSGFKAAVRDFPKHRVMTDLPDAKALEGDRTAVICSTDYHALQVVRLRNGRTRGIIGFDNIRILELCDIKVDSVSYPVHEMAQNAVEMIIHGSRDSVFVPHTIVKRGSIG
jgi:LacI family transcriptional regulator